MKRDNGLCFRCDEKYSIGNRCENKELDVLMVNDELDNGEDEKAVEEKVDDSKEGVEKAVELSINSVVRLTTPKIMKLKEFVRQQEVVILIDCGASHTFISMDLVEYLAIPKQPTSSYGVLMGMRLSVKKERICKGVVLSLLNIDIVENFMPLELGSSDVILGMQWLATLEGM